MNSFYYNFKQRLICKEMLHHASAWIPIKAMWSNSNISSIGIICYCSLAAKKFGCFLKFLKRRLKDFLLPPFWWSFTEKLLAKNSASNPCFSCDKFCWKPAHNPGNLLEKKLQPSKFGSHGKKETILNRWIYSKSCQYRGLWLMFQWQALTLKLD